MIGENILQFLQQLAVNNNRDWFHANKDLYDTARKKFEAVVGLLIYEIGRFDDDISGLRPKDCIFRIFRDIRFSNDKTPYKTNFGASLARGGRKSPFAGYYFHIEPGDYFLAGGVYMPPSPVLKAIRNDIHTHIDEFKEILNTAEFKKLPGDLWGETLSAPPKGFSKEVEHIGLLKHKHYLVISELTGNQIGNKDFIQLAAGRYRAMYPFIRFLNDAIESVV